MKLQSALNSICLVIGVSLGNCSLVMAATDANSTPAIVDAATSCPLKLAELNNICATKTVEAASSCDDSQNSGLAQAQQVAVALGQSTSASIEAACSTMGKISQAANAATAAYQMSCQNSVGTCTSACSSALQYYTACSKSGYTDDSVQAAIKDSAKSCTALQAKANQTQQAIQNLLQTAIQAQNCASLTSGTTAATTDFCKANPSLAGCSSTKVDCSSAEMATNKVCICSKNQNDPSCISATSATEQASSAPTATRTTSSASADTLGDLYGTPEISQASLNKSAAESAVDGKQGSGTSFSSGGDFGSADPRGRDKNSSSASDSGTVVGSGFYGSSGGSSGGSGGSSSSSISTDNLYVGKNISASEAKKSMDLRKFLPGGPLAPQAQGLAGSSGVDGITGPNSDIWQKVKNRYQVVTPSLMP